MRNPESGMRNVGRLLPALMAMLWLAVACAAAPDKAPPHSASDKGPPYAASQEKREAASEALKEVDTLLKQASEITGMPVRRPVKSSVASRDEIQRYIRGRLKETITPEKLRAQEIALKEFGLLPPDFALEDFTVKLLTEQAAAYYDPQRKEFLIADWTPLSLQRPAIVHELAHALQDQEIGLDEFLQGKDLNQDEQTARSAVVEGGGVLAMMEYILSLTGMKREAFPKLDEMVSSATAAELKKFPVFSAAPLYLRESLLFPYTAGMQYMTWMVEKHGKKGYTEALKNPPRSTAEVLHPGDPVPPPAGDLKPPEVSPMPSGYRQLDSDVLGEFDLRILLKQYAGDDAARRVAPAWRGLVYSVYENDSRTSAFLAHRSRWKDAEAASAFAAAYRKVLAARGRRNARVNVAGDTVSIIEGLPGAAPR